MAGQSPFLITFVLTSLALALMCGKVTAVATPVAYHQTSLYTCSSPDCLSTGQHFLELWADIARPQHCIVCLRGVAAVGGEVWEEGHPFERLRVFADAAASRVSRLPDTRGAAGQLRSAPPCPGLWCVEAKSLTAHPNLLHPPFLR